MRVRLVCYEDGGWILGKIAGKLRDELRLLGVDADVASVPDPAADVNHHIIYIDYAGRMPETLDTVMVTHIDADWKFRRLKAQLEQGAVGVCMSADTVKTLSAAGIPADRLFYINPAHDGVLAPRPLRIGITTRVYPDGRKREEMLLQLAGGIEPAAFSFSIIGEGWDRIVADLRKRGFAVDYRPQFDLDEYRALIPSLDYYLYLGCDEGSMGFVDALSAGVPTIATPQGFHLDAAGGLVHPFTSLEELRAVFRGIAASRQALADSVSRWTWREYAVKHRDLWEYLLSGKRPDGIGALDAGGEGRHLAGRVAARLSFVAGSLRSLRASFRKGAS